MMLQGDKMFQTKHLLTYVLTLQSYNMAEFYVILKSCMITEPLVKQITHQQTITVPVAADVAEQTTTQQR